MQRCWPIWHVHVSSSFGFPGAEGPYIQGRVDGHDSLGGFGLQDVVLGPNQAETLIARHEISVQNWNKRQGGILGFLKLLNGDALESLDSLRGGQALVPQSTDQGFIARLGHGLADGADRRWSAAHGDNPRDEWLFSV